MVYFTLGSAQGSNQWESKSSSNQWAGSQSDSAQRQTDRWPAVVATVPDQRTALRPQMVGQTLIPTAHPSNVFLGAAAQAANIMMGAMGTARPTDVRYDAYKSLPGGAATRRY